MPMLGPAIGPICGGFITEGTTWRWVFYATSIADAVIQVIGIFFLTETYPPKILYRKAQRLRKETGNNILRTEFEPADGKHHHLRTISTALVRPFRLITTQPIVQVLAIYQAFIYGVMYLVLSTFPGLWTNVYHQSIGMSGLNYISMAIGFFIGAQSAGRANDFIYKRLSAKSPTKTGRPEFRTPLLVPGSLLIPMGLFIYGWTAQYHTHWIGPNIGVCLFSIGGIVCFQGLQTYIVDAYTRYAASALAASSMLRSTAGFGFPLFAPYMYQELDYGWGNSLLAFIAIGLGIPAPALLWFFGERLRARSKFAAGGY